MSITSDTLGSELSYLTAFHKIMSFFSLKRVVEQPDLVLPIYHYNALLAEAAEGFAMPPNVAPSYNVRSYTVLQAPLDKEDACFLPPAPSASNRRIRRSRIFAVGDQ